MPFPIQERRVLLAVKGVGPTVVARLEQMGIESLAQLRRENAADILARGARLAGSSCWKNSPQARAAIAGAIEAAHRAMHPPAPEAAPATPAKSPRRPATKTINSIAARA
jgi:predicted RecB family nuclease